MKKAVLIFLFILAITHAIGQNSGNAEVNSLEDAKYYYHTGLYENSALERFIVLAEKDNPEALYYISRICSRGWCHGKNKLPDFKKWYKPTISFLKEKGTGEAFFYIGKIYQKLDMYKTAVKFYKKAVKKGNIASMYLVGMVYSQSSIKKVKDIGLRLLLKAAEKGSIGARVVIYEILGKKLGREIKINWKKRDKMRRIVKNKIKKRLRIGSRALRLENKRNKPALMQRLLRLRTKLLGSRKKVSFQKPGGFYKVNYAGVVRVLRKTRKMRIGKIKNFERRVLKIYRGIEAIHKKTGILPRYAGAYQPAYYYYLPK